MESRQTVITFSSWVPVMKNWAPAKKISLLSLNPGKIMTGLVPFLCLRYVRTCLITSLTILRVSWVQASQEHCFLGVCLSRLLAIWRNLRIWWQLQSRVIGSRSVIYQRFVFSLYFPNFSNSYRAIWAALFPCGGYPWLSFPSFLTDIILLSLCSKHTLKPSFILGKGVCRGVHYFSYFWSIHRLLVLVRTALLRRF